MTLTPKEDARRAGQRAEVAAAEAMLGRELTPAELQAGTLEQAPLEGELWDALQRAGCPALEVGDRIIEGATQWLTVLDELDDAGRASVSRALAARESEPPEPAPESSPEEPVKTVFHIAVNATFNDAARAACATLLGQTVGAFVSALATAGGSGSEEAAADLDQDDA